MIGNSPTGRGDGALPYKKDKVSCRKFWKQPAKWYQDSVLCARLEMFFTPKRYVPILKQHITSSLIFLRVPQKLSAWTIESLTPLDIPKLLF